MGGFTVLQLGYGMQGKASLLDILSNKSISKVIVADISDEIGPFRKARTKGESL